MSLELIVINFYSIYQKAAEIGNCSYIHTYIHTYIHYFIYPRIFRVAYAANISEHLAIRREIDHHTGNYVPYSFRTVCGFFYVVRRSLRFIVLIRED